MRFALLGSGSKGNATLVAAGDTVLLIDCGYSVRAFDERAQELGVDPGAIDAVLVTHEHDDHAGGVGGLARRYDLPVYWTRGTALAAAARCGEVVRAQCFSSHAAFTIGDIEIRPVPVPHDAREPSQFVFVHGGARLGLLTDLGSLTPHVLAEYTDCDALIVEFNHDAARLESSGYPVALKRRIAGRYGHLSNADAQTLLARVASPRLRRVIAAHLSEQTNHPELVAARLDETAATTHFEWQLAAQDRVLPWIAV